MKSSKNIDEISDFYLNYSSKVSLFMIPHHGANPDFNPQFLDCLPNLQLCYVAAGDNTYGHPSKHLLARILKEQSVPIQQVSERPNSRIVSESLIDKPSSS